MVIDAIVKYSLNQFVMKPKKRTALKVVRGVQAASAIVAVSSLMMAPMEADGYCHDRPGVTNTGSCTQDPDYHNGAYACLPGGVTCDSDDIFP